MTKDFAPRGARVYTIKVTLMGSDPPIWRRLEVTNAMTLGELHYALQIAMGWTESHLHEFEIEGERYGRIPDEMFDDPPLDEDSVILELLIKRKGQRFCYTYDFGDNWTHEVIVESIGSVKKGAHYPVCLEGERACPPEDCGGIPGYYEMLQILEDSDHEEYETYKEWLPANFDADAFDLIKTNKGLEDMDKWLANWD